MKTKRVLIVFSNPPAPFGNAAARWYYVLLRGMRELGHDVTALAASGSPDETAEAHRLFPGPAFDLRCYPFPNRTGLLSKWESFRKPHSYNFSPELVRDLAVEMTHGYDVLHCEQLWSGWLGIGAPRKTVVNVHYSFEVDCSHVSPTSLHERLLIMRTRQAERYLLRQFPTICALTKPLAERISAINPDCRIAVIPLGIDACLYQYQDPKRDLERPTIGMIGSFDWQPTLLAGKRLLCDLWPRIRCQCPGARLLLVGRNVCSAMADLPTEGVELHENVPDTAPFFHEIDVFLYAPSHGSGMKVKVLEAFGFGSPVVTTEAGAEGIPITPGVHAGIGVTDEELVTEAINLLQDRVCARSRARAARQLLESYCEPHRCVQQFSDLYSAI